MIEEPRADRIDRTEAVVLERAVWRKWNRYTWSGLVILGIGCLLITWGITLNTGAYSAEGLLVGFGAIIVLVGFIRVAIGFINPALPSDLYRRVRRRRSNSSEIIETMQAGSPPAGS